MTVSSVFNPYTGRLRAHPNRNIDSPFLLGVNRVAVKTISLYSSSALIIYHPTNTNSTAFTIYHIDQNGNYVNRENIDWQFDFGTQSTKATVISFKSEIYSASISTTNFVLGGTINSAVLSTSLADFISWIKPTRTLPSSILSLTTEDVCKANAAKSQLALGIPVNVGVEFCECYPDQPLVDGQAFIPPLSIQTPAYTTSGLTPVDATDMSIVVSQGTFTNSKLLFAKDVTTSWTTPLIPTVVGDGCDLSPSFFTHAFSFLPDTTQTHSWVIGMVVISLTGNTLLTQSRMGTAILSAGTAYTATRFSAGAVFYISPEDLDGVQDCFVQFTLSDTPNSTVVVTGHDMNFAIGSNQPARKRYGFGPGTVVSYISGASVGMAIQINASQMCLHEPKPGVLQGYEPIPVAYSQPLYKAIKTIQSQPDVFGVRNLFPMKEEAIVSNDYLFWVEVLSMSQKLKSDDSNVMSELEDLVNRYPKQFSGELPEGMPQARASFKSFLRRASKWLNRNVAKPVLTPVGQAIHQAAKNFGTIGANVITNASTNLLTNAMQPKAATMPFYQMGPPIPDVNLNRFSSTKSLQTSEDLDFKLEVPFPEVEWFSMSKQTFRFPKPMCSTSALNAGRVISSTAEDYYHKHPHSDYATVETSLPTVDVDIYDITEFPVVLEGTSVVSQSFGSLEGSQLYCIVAKEKIPDTCLVSQTPKHLVYNCDEENIPTSKTPIVLMKLIKKQGNKVTLSSPARFLAGSSFLLAREMWDRGIRGHGIAYSGSVVDGQILPIPADTMGTKRACCARNEVILVGNSPLADVRVANFADIYRSLLIYCNSNPNFKPIASCKSYSLAYAPIGHGKVYNNTTGKTTTIKEYYVMLKQDLKTIINKLNSDDETPFRRFFQLQQEIVKGLVDQRMTVLRTQDIVEITKLENTEHNCNGFYELISLDGKVISGVLISKINNTYLIELGEESFLISFSHVAETSDAILSTTLNCMITRPCASQRSYERRRTKPNDKQSCPVPQARMLPVTDVDKVFESLKDLLKNPDAQKPQITTKTSKGKNPKQRFNTSQLINKVVDDRAIPDKKLAANLKKMTILQYEFSSPTNIPMKVLKMAQAQAFKDVRIPLLTKVENSGDFKEVPANFLKFLVIHVFVDMDPNILTPLIPEFPQDVLEVYRDFKAMALNPDTALKSKYYTTLAYFRKKLELKSIQYANQLLENGIKGGRGQAPAFEVEDFQVGERLPDQFNVGGDIKKER